MTKAPAPAPAPPPGQPGQPLDAVDVNCDVGESFGRYRIGEDEAVIPLVSSISVACGFHAGDPGEMRAAVTRAAAAGVAVGAHPGFPDRAGFGRRAMALSPSEIADLVVYQVGALAAFARAAGVEIQHVKPHGALYHAAARQRSVADAVARATGEAAPRLLLIGLAGTELEEAAARAGIAFAAEAFVDRGYLPDGTLAPRDQPGAVIADAGDVARRAVRLCREGRVAAAGGGDIQVRVDTLCLHGDDPGVAARAQAVRSALAAAGVAIRPLRDGARRPA